MQLAACGVRPVTCTTYDLQPAARAACNPCTTAKGDLVRVAFDDTLTAKRMHWEYGNLSSVSQHGELATIAMENGATETIARCSIQLGSSK